MCVCAVQVWADFEQLARVIAPGAEAGGYRVFVEDQGGSYSDTDHCTSWWDGAQFSEQSEDNGKTLVVFVGAGTIGITKDSRGRQFGPSILAPFARVMVGGSVGYVDGFVVARSVGASGQGGGSVQMHGDGYAGPLTCSANGGSTPLPGAGCANTCKYPSDGECDGDSHRRAGPSRWSLPACRCMCLCVYARARVRDHHAGPCLLRAGPSPRAPHAAVPPPPPTSAITAHN